MGRYTIWTATEAELDTVMRLLHDRVQWLRDRGSDQWSTYRRWRPEMEVSIRQHQTWLLRDDHNHEAVGTITISPDGDPEFWSEQERAAPSLYLAKLATNPARKGQGLGRLLLDVSLYLAAAEGYQEVRMDVWRTATKLHSYYQRQGWSHVRTVELPHRHSGTLFTRHVVAPAVNLPPRGVELRPAGGHNVPSPPLTPAERAWHAV